MRSTMAQLNCRRGWLSFYALMIVVILGFYIAGTQVSSIDQSQSYRLRVFEAQAMQAADAGLAYALRDTASNAGQWSPMTATAAQAVIPRADTIAIWTDDTGVSSSTNKMIVWGGVTATGAPTIFAGIYNPLVATWTVATSTNAPAARTNHTAVWTGNTGNPATANRLIVWGGIPLDPPQPATNTGGIYDPASDTWTLLSTTEANLPEARYDHTAVWTDSEMIIWGGRKSNLDSEKLADGGRYNPLTKTWSSINLIIAPSKRCKHSAVWTGSEMIVWGGLTTPGNSPTDDGGMYFPSTDSWQSIPAPGFLGARALHSAVWTGSEMIVWGGVGNQQYGDGGIYDPSDETWRAVQEPVIPGEDIQRRGHAAVWMDDVMVIWGGLTSAAVAASSGASLRPACGHWGMVTAEDAPSPRHGAAAVWTGSEMLIWGGRDSLNNVVNNGGLWRPPPMIPASNATRYEMTANSAQIATISMQYEVSSFTPAIVTATATVLDLNGRAISSRSIQGCLDVERHRYNKGCWTRP